MLKNKSQLRRRLLAKRSALSAASVANTSQVICNKLISEVDWPSFKNLNIYLSARDWNEVDTAPIIDYVKGHWPEIRVALVAATLKQPLPQQKFDLIIAPTLGFDTDLNRLGRGGGWYDRFLATQPSALKVGLCFQSGLVKDGIPTEPFDVALDIIITETGIMRRL